MNEQKKKALGWSLLAGTMTFIILAFFTESSEDVPLSFVTIVLLIASLVIAIPVYYVKK